jgi:hypothetical protein
MSGSAFVSASATAPEHLCPVDVMHIAHFCPAHRVKRAPVVCGWFSPVTGLLVCWLRFLGPPAG